MLPTLSHHCLAYTDHSACTSLLNAKNPSPKLARWAMIIQELNLTIKHHSGKRNVNADAFLEILVTSMTKANALTCLCATMMDTDVCAKVIVKLIILCLILLCLLVPLQVPLIAKQIFGTKPVKSDTPPFNLTSEGEHFS